MKYIFTEESPGTFQENMLYLRRDRWDDFGWKTYFNIYYNNKYIGDIRIAKMVQRDNDELDGATETWEELKRDGLVDHPLERTLTSNYYSLARKDTYDNLYRYVPLDDVKQFLKNIKDISYDTTYIDKINKTGVFGSSLIRGIAPEQLKITLFNASHGYQQNKYFLELCYRKNKVSSKCDFSLEINADAESLLPTNLHAIIGDNGIGKSRLLRDFVISVVMRGQVWDSSEYFSEDMTFNLKNGSDLSNVVYINLSPFDNINSQFKEIIGNSQLNYQGTVKNITILFNEDSDKLIENIFGNPLDDLLKTPAKKQFVKKVWKKFEWDKTIFKIFKYIDELELETKDCSAQRQEILRLIKTCSSGQKYLVILILSVIENVISQSVLVIDEPEDFLHPPYVAALVGLISQILKDINGVGLIATHSDVALQEIPRECVYHLLKDNNIKRPQIQTFAANVSSINREIFGVTLRSTGFYNYLEELVKKDPEKAKELLDKNLLGESGSFYLALLLER